MSHALHQLKRLCLTEPSIRDLMDLVLSGTEGRILVSANPKLPGIVPPVPKVVQKKKPKPN
jgi:hypothetical protein